MPVLRTCIAQLSTRVVVHTQMNTYTPHSTCSEARRRGLHPWLRRSGHARESAGSFLARAQREGDDRLSWRARDRTRARLVRVASHSAVPHTAEWPRVRPPPRLILLAARQPTAMAAEAAMEAPEAAAASAASLARAPPHHRTKPRDRARTCGPRAHLRIVPGSYE